MLPYEIRDGVHVMFLQPNPEKPRGGVVVLVACTVALRALVADRITST